MEESCDSIQFLLGSVVLDIPSWRDLSPIDNVEEIDGDRMESQGRSIPSTLHPCSLLLFHFF